MAIADAASSRAQRPARRLPLSRLTPGRSGRRATQAGHPGLLRPTQRIKRRLASFPAPPLRHQLRGGSSSSCERGRAAPGARLHRPEDQDAARQRPELARPSGFRSEAALDAQWTAARPSAGADLDVFRACRSSSARSRERLNAFGVCTACTTCEPSFRASRATSRALGPDQPLAAATRPECRYHARPVKPITSRPSSLHFIDGGDHGEPPGSSSGRHRGHEDVARSVRRREATSGLVSPKGDEAGSRRDSSCALPSRFLVLAAQRDWLVRWRCPTVPRAASAR